MTFFTNMVSRNDDKENVPLWCESPYSWGKKASLPAAGAALVLGIAHILAAVSQHVWEVAPLLWEATSEPLIHFSTVRPGERWISQQIQVSICNKHFTSHCTPCPPPRGGEGGVGGGGSCRCQSPLASLPCGSGVTQLNTVADLWCTI